MDILYIVGKGFSKCHNKELKYSLRSIEKYGKGVDRVFVVGYCPEWLSDKVVKVPYEQPLDGSKETDPQVKLACKHGNIISSILYTIDNTDISDEFLVSMDDHFYVRDVDFNDYPYYIKQSKNGIGTLPKEGSSEYKKTLATTRKFLEKEGLSFFNLVPHRNMHCSRKILEECREFIESGIKEKRQIEYLAYILNYQYTTYGFKPVPIKDVKIKNGFDWLKTHPKYTEVFSTIDFTQFDDLDRLIGSLYKEKSSYEK